LERRALLIVRFCSRSPRRQPALQDRGLARGWRSYSIRKPT